MAIIRIIYAAFVIISGVFVVMYVDSLSLILFIVTLALPLFLFLLLLLARILTRITVEPPATIATKGQSVSMKIHLKNLDRSNQFELQQYFSKQISFLYKG